MTTSPNDWKTDDTERLSRVFLSLTTPDEIAMFLRDLCTHRELTEMAHRWLTVRLLDQGLSYRDIAERTGVSTATITRVAQWLNRGTGGYQLVLQRTRESS
jgi:TrpR-related protein YerC/YecD